MTTVLIKKYGNRRLYDTDASRYITQEELAERVRSGTDVHVVDAKTGEDLTQSTLAQIILESRGAARLLPIPLLTELIRMGDDAIAEFFGRYMTTALELYRQARQGAQALAAYNPFVNLPFNAASALARWVSGIGPASGWDRGWGQPAAAPMSPAAGVATPPGPAAGRSDDREDVAELRRELEALKSQLGKKRR